MLFSTDCVFEDNGKLPIEQIQARFDPCNGLMLLAIERGMPMHAEMYAECSAHYARSPQPEMLAV
jgi:hypothetical protein